MATERTDGNGEGGAHMTERYTGPSAKRIADLLRHRVSFERGWFWTTTAICHGGKSDGLAFRQRPDGNGIDVHCHTGGCSAGVVITNVRRSSGCPSGRPTNRCATRQPRPPRSGLGGSDSGSGRRRWSPWSWRHRLSPATWISSS